MAHRAPPFASAADRELAHRFFAERPKARATFMQVASFMAGLGPMRLAATKSRVAFLARTRFAWVHQANLDGEVELAFLLPERAESPRLRLGPAGGRWSHHVHARGLDAELEAWLRAAYEADVAGRAA